jgi:hypothetical protein
MPDRRQAISQDGGPGLPGRSKKENGIMENSLQNLYGCIPEQIFPAAMIPLKPWSFWLL